MYVTFTITTNRDDHAAVLLGSPATAEETHNEDNDPHPDEDHGWGGERQLRGEEV